MIVAFGEDLDITKSLIYLDELAQKVCKGNPVGADVVGVNVTVTSKLEELSQFKLDVFVTWYFWPCINTSDAVNLTFVASYQLYPKPFGCKLDTICDAFWQKVWLVAVIIGVDGKGFTVIFRV